MKYITQPRRSNGKWKKELSYKTRFTLISLLIGSIMFSVIYIPDAIISLDETIHWIDESNARPVVSFVATANADITTRAKVEARIERLKQDVLATLRQEESRGHETADGELLITYDPPKVLRNSGACTVFGGERARECDSYGELQMKITFAEMCTEKQGLPTMSDIEFFTMASHIKEAEKFAIDCIINVKGSLKKWTAYEKHSTFFDYTVNEIRELEAMLND